MLLSGHGEGEIWGLAMHPAKLLFVTASEDKTVRLWDLERMVNTYCKTRTVILETL